MGKTYRANWPQALEHPRAILSMLFVNSNTLWSATDRGIFVWDLQVFRKIEK
jgi:hypothetical protein